MNRNYIALTRILAYNITMIPSIGEQILLARRKAGLTQAELAEKSGVGIRTIAEIEDTPDANPRLNTLKRLAAALDLRLQINLEEQPK